MINPCQASSERPFPIAAGTLRTALDHLSASRHRLVSSDAELQADQSEAASLGILAGVLVPTTREHSYTYLIAWLFLSLEVWASFGSSESSWRLSRHGIHSSSSSKSTSYCTAFSSTWHNRRRIVLCLLSLSSLGGLYGFQSGLSDDRRI